MRERIDSYLDGWRTGDASRLLAGTADGFFFDDPNRGRIERDAYEAYVAELWVEARAYRGDERFDHFEDLSEIVTGEKGDGTLNVWFWWQIAGTPIEGSSLVNIGSNGVLSETICYYGDTTYTKRCQPA